MRNRRIPASGWSIPLLAVAAAFADTRTLDDCRRDARANHPMSRRGELIERSRDYNLSSAARGWFPQASVTGRYTDQSDAPMRGLLAEQSQIALELSQTIWDGGAISSRRKIERLSAKSDASRLEADLHALRGRVDQVFLGILSLEQQIVQTELLARDLAANLGRVRAFQANGVANQSDVDVLRVELLKVEGRRVELESARAAFREMLGILTGNALGDSTRLERPSLAPSSSTKAVLRPEMAVFDARSELIAAQKDLVVAGNRPRLGAFVQIGRGKPGLVLSNREYASFWVAGMRFTWELGGFWRQGNELARIGLQRRNVELQRESFLLEANLDISRQRREIEKHRELLRRDDEIVALRERIRKAAEAKLENGAMSVSDLVREVNAEALARQEKALHEMQLLSAVAELNSTTNDRASTP